MALPESKRLTIHLGRYHGLEIEVAEMLRRKGYSNEIVFHDDFKEMASCCDVIASAVTIAHEQFAEPSVYKPGTLLVPIHTRGFQDCDTCFDRIIVDDKNGHVKSFAHFSEFRYCAELNEVLADPGKGRSSDDERIIAYNIGIAARDFYYAGKIYKLLEKKLPDISEGDAPAKYWVGEN